jgi:hypothetical protein
MKEQRPCRVPSSLAEVVSGYGGVTSLSATRPLYIPVLLARRAPADRRHLVV